jgi:predicted HicB family RNase H-like nuclease
MGAKYTEAQARSAKKYLEQFAEIRIRLKPEEKKAIQEQAKEAGKSVNQHIIDKMLKS